MKRLVIGGAFVGLLASVYAANYLINRYHFVRVWPTHLEAPAGVYMAGLAFLFRDTVQRLASAWVALAGIACGAGLTLVLVSPNLAGASAAAFSASEVTGLVVLAALGRRLLPAIVAAQLAAAAVDSLLFLWLAFGNVRFWEGQAVGKVSVLALAFPAVYLTRRATQREDAPHGRLA